MGICDTLILVNTTRGIASVALCYYHVSQGVFPRETIADRPRCCSPRLDWLCRPNHEANVWRPGSLGFTMNRDTVVIGRDKR